VAYLHQSPGKLVQLANLLGHESLDTTAIYTQPSGEELAKASEAESDPQGVSRRTSRHDLDVENQVNEDLLAFLKVGQDQNKGGSISIPDQKLSRLEADALRKP
jgi:hypothetical protein